MLAADLSNRARHDAPSATLMKSLASTQALNGVLREAEALRQRLIECSVENLAAREVTGTASDFAGVLARWLALGPPPLRQPAPGGWA